MIDFPGYERVARKTGESNNTTVLEALVKQMENFASQTDNLRKCVESLQNDKSDLQKRVSLLESALRPIG